MHLQRYRRCHRLAALEKQKNLYTHADKWVWQKAETRCSVFLAYFSHNSCIFSSYFLHISRYMPEKRKAAARAFRVCKRAASQYMNGLVRAMWASVGLVLWVHAQVSNTSQFSDWYTIAVCVSSCYTYRFSECCVCESMLWLLLSALCWRMLTHTHSIRQHTSAYVCVSPC
jgi:hypothetical protein